MKEKEVQGGKEGREGKEEGGKEGKEGKGDKLNLLDLPIQRKIHELTRLNREKE
ncbi:MAG: hypothetical protein HC916_14575 [Coleofasciculaceae cyanobacterium SM2_1_6]|nr:hypothetical protein [Coleofasciculaceae cyanobacterium SM2_1_6]